MTFKTSYILGTIWRSALWLFIFTAGFWFIPVWFGLGVCLVSYSLVGYIMLGQKQVFKATSYAVVKRLVCFLFSPITMVYVIIWTITHGMPRFGFA